MSLTLSNKSTILANDNSLGKLIVGQLDAEAVLIGPLAAARDLEIGTSARRRRCASHQWKRIGKGRRRAKRVNRL